MEKIIKKGIIIGVIIGSFFGTIDLYAMTTVTGTSTATLVVTSDFSAFDKIIGYYGDYTFATGFALTINPINTSPFNISQSDFSSVATDETTALKLVGTYTGCGGSSLDYSDCLATGEPVGGGYYVVDGVWYEIGDTPPVYGCTDSEANNYDPEATVDDDSCTYDTPPTDHTANETEIILTFYILLVAMSVGMVCGIIALVFYASLAIIRSRK